MRIPSGAVGRSAVPGRAAALVAITVLLGAMLGTTTAVAQTPSLPVLSVADVTVQEGNRNMVFTVRLDRVSDEDVYFSHSTEAVTATRNADYVDEPGSLAIPAGQRTARIVVRVLEDTVREDTETFRLDVHGIDGAIPAGGIGGLEATGTITDDNDPLSDLVVENVVASEGDSLTFTVSLREDPGTKKVTVNYRTVNGTAVASTPGRTGDYEPASGTLEFDGYAGPIAVTVQLLSDDIDEFDEALGLRLSNASNASAPRDAATGVILDGNPMPDLAVSDVEGEEGETFTFAVTLNVPSGREVTATYATSDGSAVAGRDYGAARGTLKFPPGVTERRVSVRTFNDAYSEDDTEVFYLQLTSITNAYYGRGARGLHGHGYGTIVDNDEPGNDEPDAPPGTAPGLDRGRLTGGGGPGTVGGGEPGDAGGGEPGDAGGGEPGDAGGGSAPAAGEVIAPRIKALVNDAVLQLGGPPVELDLPTVIGSPTDSHRALAADPRVVTVVVSGSRLTLTPKAVGATTVSVSATNSRGTALQSFRVTVVAAGTGSSPDDSLGVTAIQRTAPTIVSLLGDRTITVGDPPTVLDVAAAFGGAPATTYRAAAGDPRLVTAVISGSNLSLTGLTPGATTVSVRASNTKGEALQTFRVTVRTGSTEDTTPPGSQ